MLGRMNKKNTNEKKRKQGTARKGGKKQMYKRQIVKE
jgi:hypothetical protein